MTSITYVDGDATAPIGEGNKVIAHICNDIGVWGAGFVMALSKRWHRPETWYKTHKDDLTLGKLQMIPVTIDTYVANMVAQEGVGTDCQGREPVRYDSLIICLRKLNGWIKKREVYNGSGSIHDGEWSVHMPRIGCGLGGGRWEIVEPIIRIELCERDIPVTVYDWKG